MFFSGVGGAVLQNVFKCLYESIICDCDVFSLFCPKVAKKKINAPLNEAINILKVAINNVYKNIIRKPSR